MISTFLMPRFMVPGIQPTKCIIFHASPIFPGERAALCNPYLWHQEERRAQSPLVHTVACSSCCVAFCCDLSLSMSCWTLRHQARGKMTLLINDCPAHVAYRKPPLICDGFCHKLNGLCHTSMGQCLSVREILHVPRVSNNTILFIF